MIFRNSKFTQNLKINCLSYKFNKSGHFKDGRE